MCTLNSFDVIMLYDNVPTVNYEKLNVDFNISRSWICPSERILFSLNESNMCSSCLGGPAFREESEGMLSHHAFPCFDDHNIRVY